MAQKTTCLGSMWNEKLKQNLKPAFDGKEILIKMVEMKSLFKT